MSRAVVKDIQRAVCDYYEVDPSALFARVRSRDADDARQVGMFLAREMTRLSFRQIAARFNRSDHSTVCHAHRKIAANWCDYGRDVEAIRQRLAA
jgi:chromosomal replication initiator protein